MANNTGTGSPCGACKFLRRKCVQDCIFAPYFSSEQGPTQFADVHKVFGASNVSKLLFHVPLPHRFEAVSSITYEAQARVRDPVYGCVAHIFQLQHQVAYLQAQVMKMKAQLMLNNNFEGDSLSLENHKVGFSVGLGFHQNRTYPTYMNSSSISPQSSLHSVDNSNDGHIGKQEIQRRYPDWHLSFQSCNKKRLISNNNDLSDLQVLALRMMKN